jgi:hypothetical protein
MPRSSKRKRRCNEAEETCKIDSLQIEQDQFFNSIRKLYEERVLCDVTFRISGQLFYAHRVILASANSFLGAMILSGMSESDQKVIDLDADPVLFQYILDFLYGISIEVPKAASEKLM